MARKALYKTDKGYYQGAYRVSVKANRPNWTLAQVTGTLAWMWKHVATAAERAECLRLRVAKSVDKPFVANVANIPQDPKSADDPAPVVPPIPAAAPIVAPTPVAAPTHDRVFPYMPSLQEMDVELPVFVLGPDGTAAHDVRERLLGKRGSDRIDDLIEEPERKRWHGTHWLGKGATGYCAHWVRTDEHNNIDKRLAVRDIPTAPPRDWIHPINWRDQLPREIAILRRLHEQNGHDHNIHRYEGHSLDARKRRYRVYTEVCELGDLLSALDSYSRDWDRRRCQFTWHGKHPEITAAMSNENGLNEDNLDLHVREVRKEVFQRYLLLDRQSEAFSPYEEYQHLSLDALEQIAMQNIMEHPKHIPEAFLWRVFDQLVDALLIMQRGADPLIGDKRWKEIVHKDLHLCNIFVKRTEGGPGSHLSDDGIITFLSNGYPQVVMADFDTSFFDLQDDDEEYQDNPEQYVWERPDGRYAPESFQVFQNQQRLPIKLTSATDVWGVGQIMWNLVRNIPCLYTTFGPFFDRGEGSYGRRLNNGIPHANDDLANLLSGDEPFPVSLKYSEELKDAIRSCLRYMPAERIKLAELKEITVRNMLFHLGNPESSGPLYINASVENELYRVGDRYSG